MTATPTPSNRPSLYVEPNVDALHTVTELVDPFTAYVGVQRSGTIMIAAVGDSLDDIIDNADSAYDTLTKAGYPVSRFSTGILYLPIDEQEPRS